MGLKRSPLDVQPVWSGYNCTRVFHRFRSGIEPKIVLNRKVFCTRNTFARIIYFTRIFFHSFFLSFFFHSNNFKSIIRIVISSRKNPFPSPLSLSLDRTCNPPSWISTGFQCRFGRILYTVDNIFHRQLAVMSDKSILGEGEGREGLGRGHDKQLPRGVHVVGRERVRSLQPYPIPRFRRRLFYQWFDSTRFDSRLWKTKSKLVARSMDRSICRKER